MQCFVELGYSVVEAGNEMVSQRSLRRLGCHGFFC